MTEITRIIGIDPGLRRTGWGIVTSEGTRLMLHAGLEAVLQEHAPDEAAVEETFVNRDPQSALKLGQARGIALVVPALRGLSVDEYAANLVKKTVVGVGHADKVQVQAMIRVLLPKANTKSADAADALAVAICHAQHRGSRALLARVAGR
jgi:crossover junction endodeoxyribonuclease RuvC